MNAKQSDYALIQIHFDSATSGGICYLVSALDNGQDDFSTTDKEFAFGESSSGDISTQVVDICMKVASEYPNTPIEALVYPGAPRKNIIAIGVEFGNVRFLLQSELSKSSPGGVVVTEAVAKWRGDKIAEKVQAEQNQESNSDADNDVADKVTYVGTDGSLNRFYAGGSYGWIASDGSFGYGAVKTGESSLVCELIAIQEMLTSIEHKQDIRILVDNRLAIKMARDPKSMPNSRLVSKRAGRLAEDIHNLLKRRKNVELRWVKGHSGHPLNEGADRLARNARLAQSFNQDVDTVKRIAQGIADDVSEEYASYAESIS
jgi:ribonuclease HI